jgi:Sulfotransferase family
MARKDNETKHSPFFVVGCGRSGTTLLRTMLNRHSQVAIPLESLFIVDYLRAKPSLSQNRLVREMAGEYELGEWDMPVGAEDLASTADPREAIEKLHEMYAAKHGKTIWGQKTPRFVRHGELLKRAWPNAKFVHVVRDPRAVVSSLIRSDQHQSNALFGSKRWLNDVAAGLKLQEKFPNDVLLVRYEDLVRNPEHEVRKVCDHLGLDYEPETVSPKGTETKEYGAWYQNAHALLDRPPDPDRIDLWRKKLTPRQLRLVESMCGELMTKLGYEPTETPGGNDRPYTSALLAQRALGFLSQVIKAQRDRRGYLNSVMRRKIVVRGLNKSLREGL